MLTFLRFHRRGLAGTLAVALSLNVSTSIGSDGNGADESDGLSESGRSEERLPTDPRGFDRVSVWVEALGDDRPIARDEAERRIGRLLGDADDATFDRIGQHLRLGVLRAGLNQDWEAQLRLERLLAELGEAQHRWEVNKFIEPESSDSRFLHGDLANSGRLALKWQTFQTRAGNDIESRQVFARLAGEAGPSWQWLSMLKQDHDDCAVFVSHLGCVAPTEPHFHAVESRLVFRRLDQFAWADRTMSRSHPDSRLLGRLIDRTLWDNPYGWSVEQRLRLALMYRRDRVALRIADSVWLSDHRLPIDWAAAMMALGQVRRRGLTGIAKETTEWASRWDAIHDSMSDRRLLAKSPRDLTPGLKSSLFDFASISTRVQDVAAWVLMDLGGWDARQHGMPQLQADPIWGVRRCSIGFATQYERERQLGQWGKSN